MPFLVWLFRPAIFFFFFIFLVFLWQWLTSQLPKLPTCQSRYTLVHFFSLSLSCLCGISWASSLAPSSFRVCCIVCYRCRRCCCWFQDGRNNNNKKETTRRNIGLRQVHTRKSQSRQLTITRTVFPSATNQLCTYTRRHTSRTMRTIIPCVCVCVLYHQLSSYTTAFIWLLAASLGR